MTKHKERATVSDVIRIIREEHAKAMAEKRGDGARDVVEAMGE